jgi:hypothetical protein
VAGAFLDIVEAGKSFRCEHGERRQRVMKKESVDIKDRLKEVRPEY